MVRPVFPQIEPTPSLLHTVFPYTNAIHHPPALLLNVGRVESTGGDYHHYYDGITPSVGRLIDALDAERIAVAAALGVTIERLPQFFFRMGYTNAAGRDGGTAYDVFHNSEPNRWIKAPATIDHRFLNEDVPYGLVAIAELGRVGRRGDAVRGRGHRHRIDRRRRGRYRDEGLTRERMGIGGMTVADAIDAAADRPQMRWRLSPLSHGLCGSSFVDNRLMLLLMILSSITLPPHAHAEREMQ